MCHHQSTNPFYFLLIQSDWFLSENNIHKTIDQISIFDVFIVIIMATSIPNLLCMHHSLITYFLLPSCVLILIYHIPPQSKDRPKTIFFAEFVCRPPVRHGSFFMWILFGYSSFDLSDLILLLWSTHTNTLHTLYYGLVKSDSAAAVEMK
jgi:hypothetical protein